MPSDRCADGGTVYSYVVRPMCRWWDNSQLCRQTDVPMVGQFTVMSSDRCADGWTIYSYVVRPMYRWWGNSQLCRQTDVPMVGQFTVMPSDRCADGGTIHSHAVGAMYWCWDKSPLWGGTDVQLVRQITDPSASEIHSASSGVSGELTQGARLGVIESGARLNHECGSCLRDVDIWVCQAFLGSGRLRFHSYRSDTLSWGRELIWTVDRWYDGFVVVRFVCFFYIYIYIYIYMFLCSSRRSQGQILLRQL